MVAASIEVSLEENPKGYYTIGDRVKGTINVIVVKDIPLKDIHVKLEGKVVVQVYQKESRMRGSNSFPLREDGHSEEIHSLFEFREIVFPPKDVRDLSSSNFSLVPGEYEYGFEFRFPEQAVEPTLETSLFCTIFTGDFGGLSAQNSSVSLPPSLQECDYVGSSVEVTYMVRATIKRDSNIKRDIHHEIVLKYLPFQEPSLFGSNTISSTSKLKALKKIPDTIAVEDKTSKGGYRLVKAEKTPHGFTKLKNLVRKKEETDSIFVDPIKVPFSLHLRSEVCYESVGQNLNLRLYLISDLSPKRFIGYDNNSTGLGIVYLKSLNIRLNHMTSLLAYGHKTSLLGTDELLSEEYDDLKIDLAHCLIRSESGISSYEISIPEEAYLQVSIPLDKIPSFSYPTVQREHQIEVSASFTGTNTDSGFLRAKTLHLVSPIVVLSGVNNEPPLFRSNQLETNKDQLPRYTESTN